jgi:sulfite exporter TauE/SafE
MEIKIRKIVLMRISLFLLIFVSGYILLRFTLFNHVSTLPEGLSLWGIFLTGLVTGGLTCLAVQGGLLAATLAQREEQRLTDKSARTGNALPILSFLIAKLVAYTILGFLLGWLGSLVQLSLSAKVIMQFAVGIFMIGTALNILNVHPIFRYFAIQPPKFLARLVRKQSKRADLFAPVLLGAFTIFIPCGTTQAMMALAIGSGSPILGAATLFAFILGTSPLFFILGFLATKLGDALQQKFMKFAAVALILLAVYNLNGAFALSGIQFPPRSDTPVSSKTENTQSPSVRTETTSTGTSAIAIMIGQAGYTPKVISVKAGSKVMLKLSNKDAYSCAQAFTIPSLGLQEVVVPGKEVSVQFTAPQTPGTLPFMCSMGMYRGVINVI